MEETRNEHHPRLLGQFAGWDYSLRHLPRGFPGRIFGEAGKAQKCKKYLNLLVGAPRFELGTPSPPDWCANRAALRSEREGIIVAAGIPHNKLQEIIILLALLAPLFFPSVTDRFRRHPTGVRARVLATRLLISTCGGRRV
jgi:hypothetical protein